MADLELPLSRRCGFCDSPQGGHEADEIADDSMFIAAFDPPTVLALLSRLEAAEKVIADALDVFRPGASVPLGVSEARHFDRLLAEGHRILSAYTKGTD